MTERNLILDAALNYSQFGWYVFPVTSDKKPLVKWGTQSSVDPGQISAWFNRQKPVNIGLNCGLSNLVVIDIDTDPGPANFLALCAGRDLPDTCTAKTSRGYHLYFHVGKNQIRNSASELAEKIDVRGKGGYVVLPPSTHKSGFVYEWLPGLAPWDRLPAVIPDWLEQLILNAHAKKRGPTVWLENAERTLTRAVKAVESAVEGKRNEALNAHAYRVGQVLHLLDAEKAVATLAVAATAADNPLPVDEIERTVRAGIEAGRGNPLYTYQPWQDYLQFDGKGNVKAQESNTISLIQKHPDLENAFSFNRQTLETTVDVPLPWDVEGEVYPRVWTDTDEIHLAAWAARLNPSVPIVSHFGGTVVSRLSKMRSVDPIRTYLEGLVWDGVERLGKIPTEIFGEQPQPLHDQKMIKFFIGAVARALQERCKMDTMMVLLGSQGENKSRFCQALPPDPAWYVTLSSTDNDRDSLSKFHGPWIVEDAEMVWQSAKDSARIKNIISTEADTYRLPYATNNSTHKRSCVLIGTTNDHTFLTDPTANRRFWVFEVNDLIPINRVEKERDQWWAEAVARYRVGEHWWFDTREENRILEAQVDKYRQKDAFEEKIAYALTQKYLPSDLYHVEQIGPDGLLTKFTTSQAALWCGVEAKDNRAIHVRLGNACRAVYLYLGRQQVGLIRSTWYSTTRKL